MEKEVKSDQKHDTAENSAGSSQKQDGLSRRKFLSGTSGAALAIAATGLVGSRALGRTSDAPSGEEAAEKPQARPTTAAAKPVKSLNYPHLLSPMKIGNHVLKNHIIGTPGSAHLLLQGPELYPNDAMIANFANVARKGASVVVLSQVTKVHPEYELDVLKLRKKYPNPINPDHGTDAGHWPVWDLANAGCQNLFSQLTEGVHFYDSLCLAKPDMWMPAGYDVSPGKIKQIEVSTRTRETVGATAIGAPAEEAKKEISEEQLQDIIDKVLLQAVLIKECGFDGMFIHCAYRAAVTARMMSPLTNFRTDKYGGSLENRARFCINLFDAIKKRCGEDFFLIASMSGCEPEGGYTLDDGAQFAKLFTGHVDMIDLKGDPGDRIGTPPYFMKERTPFLYMTDHYKKKGVTLPLNSNGGFTNLDWAEEALAANKTDTVGMCRAFICNRDILHPAVEGRSEDVRPCIRCNRCYGNGSFYPWNSTCAVNPEWGLEHKLSQMISPPTDQKKVAVIGGGPAGMEAARIAAERGHTVTLYEKSGQLGGIFNVFDNVSFKWPHKDFRDYLVRQVGKSKVTVRLNTEADPAMIERGGYDAVIVAIGAEPIVPDIPGIGGKNVIYAVDAHGKENTLAKDVVIIGGGYVGTETGMHLAQKGHRVTVLEAAKVLAGDAARFKFYSEFQYTWEHLSNFKPILQASCNAITKDGVTYIDADGKQQSIKAGSVVVAVGMKPRTDPALQFAGISKWFYRIGDCQEAGDVRTAIRSAFSAASML